MWDCRYAITMIDYSSRWPEVAFTSSVTTEVVTAFPCSVFSRNGNPHWIVTDNGPQFTFTAFSQFLEEREIRQSRFSVYDPKSNGAVERCNRVLKECIQNVERERKPWKPAVTKFLQNYRATPHAATGESPLELLHKRKMRTKLNVFPIIGDSDLHLNVTDTVIKRQTKSKERTK